MIRPEAVDSVASTSGKVAIRSTAGFGGQVLVDEAQLELANGHRADVKRVLGAQFAAADGAACR